MKIYLSPPHLDGKEFDYVKDAFDSNWIAPIGPNLENFEAIVSDLTGKKYGLALSSGTAAIHLALKYIGIGKYDTVFCSDLTFAGSCNPVYYEGAEAVFIDSEPESWNMSPNALEQAFHDAAKHGRLPKAVIVVNLYGQSADMDKLVPICESYQVPMIEDAAESLGAAYKGVPSGSFGQYSIVSFNGNKIVTTSSGGMLLSDDLTVIEKARFWATQSREPAIHYEHKEIGYNYRLSNILAGIGIGQCEKLSEKIANKRRIFDQYKDAFRDLDGVSMMPIPEWSSPNYWLSVMTISNRDDTVQQGIIQELAKHEIESRPVWKPMHLQPVFRHCAFFAHAEMPVSDGLFNKGICLPSGTGLTAAEQATVIEIVEGKLKQGVRR